MIKRLFQSRVFKNASWLIVGKVVQMLLSLVVGVLSARYLGPSGYGLISYAQAYTAFFSAFCTLGINSVLVKELTDAPDKQGQTLGTSLLLRFASSLLSALMIVAIVGVAERDEPLTVAVVALSSIGLLFHIFETFNYYFQSKLRSKVTAIVTLVAYIVTSIYKIVLLVLGKNVLWFALATSIDYIVVAILLYAVYRYGGGQRLSFSRKRAKEILKRSCHFILPALMVSIYGYTDKFMLKAMIDEEAISFYTVAVTVCGMWTFILSAVIDSFYPTIMEAYKTSREIFEKRCRRLYATVFYLAVFASGAICALAFWIIYILYGEAFLPAVTPLRIITWYTAFSFLGMARNAWVVCEEKQKYIKYIYLAAALTNILLNLLLIPPYGAAGAALASLLTQIVTVFVIPLLIKPLRRNSVLMMEAILLRKLK